MLIENLSELRSEYMAAATQALLNGDDDYAFSLYQAVLSLVDEQQALSDPVIAECLTRVGNMYMDKGLYQDAEPYFRLAVFVYGRCPGNWNSSKALADARLAYCSRQLSKAETSREMFSPEEAAEFVETIKHLPNVTGVNNGVITYA